jgi:chlorobactene glucosyltransferase
VSWAWWTGLAIATPYWGGGLVSAAMGKPRPNLREFDPVDDPSAPLVSVIVPARNESKNVERCLRSILATKYPNIQVLLIDDRSTDDTRAIAQRLATRDSRLSVISGEELPKGWYGKPWACWQGYQLAAGTLLLFTDADTEHGPELLPRAVGAIEALRMDLLTVMPLQEMLTFWERVAQPMWFLLLGLRYAPFMKDGNMSRNPRHAIANGQFILVTRDSYEWVGGHRKVYDTVIEDLKLAVCYTEAGRRMFFAVADQDMKTRMYAGLPELLEGWSKNFFRGVLETAGSRWLAYVLALWSLFNQFFFLVPLGVLVAGIVARDAAAIAFGASGYLGLAILFGTILRSGRAPAWYGLLHPLTALTTMRIMWRAIRRGSRKIEWKGRTYSHA